MKLLKNYTGTHPYFIFTFNPLLIKNYAKQLHDEI